jgi:CRP-like cAMP-binding protein
LSKEGERVNEILVLISGKIAARIRDQTIGILGPGKLVGTAGMLFDNIQQCDFVVESPCRYIAWPIVEVQQFLDKDPDLRALIRDITSGDLATKIHYLTHPDAK